ncbi:FecCD family ABC transporter permease [Neofamilia massiliensis]|uniref:FecCD family ABC transporter permease n=1 Tax=Neofamilia massiliensis TaxID=1673724 RepID=UPI0006BB95B8|nr:iron ABC transporter permease [Neofamilia massiliensis]
MNRGRKKYFIILVLGLVLSIFVCLSIGSVSIPLREIYSILKGQVLKAPIKSANGSIILAVRFPRVLNACLVGSCLALAGAAMQGLLRNPLAEGGTLGVSAGAGLGAVLAIALDISIPFIPFGGPVVMAMIFSFLSILIILTLSYKLDYGLSTNTIILLGVIYSMFISSIQSFIIVFSSHKLEAITSWSMGSLAGSTYKGALVIFIVLIIFGLRIYSKSRELDAFAISEKNAAHIGVDVKKVKLSIMISVSAIIGVAVAFAGSIGFVGLIIPHIMRKLVGPSHKKLLLATTLAGGIFLMYADLLARVVLAPIELPIGVITSFVGSILFVNIYFSMRKVS